jgi:tRNA-dihydrouridine synthase B
MAGLTHSSFRRLIRALGGCGLVVTEMINAAAFSPKALRSHRMLHFRPEERPIAAQVAGHEPERMARAAAVAEEHGVDIVDINAGCPVRQVTGSGSGAALLRDLKLLEEILRAVHQAITVPLTLKYRSGWDPQHIVAREVAVLAEECGCAAIALHPRTRDQMYRGQADWLQVAEVVQAVRIPVWASGDVRNAADAKRCFEETGCAGLMIGRAAMSNPWIFSQMAAVLEGRPPVGPTVADRYRLLTGYITLLEEDIPSPVGVLGKIKHMVGKLQLGTPEVAAFRQRMMHSHSVEEARERIEEYFAALLEEGEPCALPSRLLP